MNTEHEKHRLILSCLGEGARLDIEQVRREFEAKYRQSKYATSEFGFTRKPDGDYWNDYVQAAWHFYLTRAQQEHEWREKQAVAAWATEDGERVVPASTMNCARMNGGAILSSMKPYNVPLYASFGVETALTRHENDAEHERSLVITSHLCVPTVADQVVEREANRVIADASADFNHI